LEYDSADVIHGVAIDLNSDQQVDFIIQSAPSLCGNGGCQYEVVNGATQAIVGEIGGVAVVILPSRDHSFLRLATYTHEGAGTGMYTLYSFNGRAYEPTVQRALTQPAQDSLVAAWHVIPGW
jgi:hypothetical protein